VVECGSATGAAGLLGVRQPAVSQALRELAGFVPCPLFDRHSAGLDARPAARALAALWSRIEAELTALPALLTDAASGVTG
ncbi:MAG: LysR family transcriptional regulator, partial [Rhodobacteraceae bacterium]|nr:LysR family transcriptional regulator [Paracoccaceae bacterium]